MPWREDDDESVLREAKVLLPTLPVIQVDLAPLEDVRPRLAACSLYALPSYYGEAVLGACWKPWLLVVRVIACDGPGC